MLSAHQVRMCRANMLQVVHSQAMANRMRTLAATILLTLRYQTIKLNTRATCHKVRLGMVNMATAIPMPTTNNTRSTEVSTGPTIWVRWVAATAQTARRSTMCAARQVPILELITIRRTLTAMGTTSNNTAEATTISPQCMVNRPTNTRAMSTLPLQPTPVAMVSLGCRIAPALLSQMMVNKSRLATHTVDQPLTPSGAAILAFRDRRANPMILRSHRLPSPPIDLAQLSILAFQANSSKLGRLGIILSHNTLSQAARRSAGTLNTATKALIIKLKAIILRLQAMVATALMQHSANTEVDMAADEGGMETSMAVLTRGVHLVDSLGRCSESLLSRYFGKRGGP